MSCRKSGWLVNVTCPLSLFFFALDDLLSEANVSAECQLDVNIQQDRSDTKTCSSFSTYRTTDVNVMGINISPSIF